GQEGTGHALPACGSLYRGASHESEVWRRHRRACRDGGKLGAAGAADLAPVYTKAPLMFVSDWAGFYLGVHGGYGWGDSILSRFFEDSDAQFKEQGGGVGRPPRYNWQDGW